MAMPAGPDGYLCGWRVRSELPLPELSPWQGIDRPPDITVRFGPVPEQLPDVVGETPFMQIGRDGSGLLWIDAVGGYLVRRDEVVIEPRAGATDAELRLFLLGSALGILCHRRGLLPLHAASIGRDGVAVAFAGPSGAGKSTLAAALAQRGYPLLSDDVCVIDAHAAGGPVVLPAFPRLKLWRDSLTALDLAAEGLERNRRFQEKYHYLARQRDVPGPVPLAAIYLLETVSAGEDWSVQRIEKPFEAVRALHDQVFRRSVAVALGYTNALFHAETQIAARVPVLRWRRRKDFARLNEDVARLAQSWIA